MSTAGAQAGPAIRRRRRAILTLVLLAAGLVPVLVVLTVARDDLREFLEFRKRVPFSRLAGCRCLPDEDLYLQRPDGVELAASLYRPAVAAGRPWIVLVHGATPRGRRLGVYRALGTGLARRGFPVLTLDQSGYGESGDPFVSGSGAGLDRRLDVLAAIRHVQAAGGADVILIGHSAGSPPVLRAAIEDDAVRGVVAIGPPRRVRERLADPDDRAFFWRRTRNIHRRNTGTELPAWFTEERWLELALGDAMEEVAPYFAGPDHKPLLLIDGERESEEDRDYLRRFVEGTGGAVQYDTVAESNHYCNAKEFAGGRWVLYDKQVVRATLDLIESWIERIAER
jgi:pimeloyl-ACP methyl ester carboxylesterase